MPPPSAVDPISSLEQSNRLMLESFAEFRRADTELENRKVAIEEACQSEESICTRIELVCALVKASNARVDEGDISRILGAFAPPSPSSSLPPATPAP